MSYKIDKNLPWFNAGGVLKEDMYVNILSGKHSDDLNPNGLFSGFLSGDVFFTSKWDGYNFVALEIQYRDIDKVLFLEILEEVKKKDFRKDSMKETPREPAAKSVPRKTVKDHFEEIEKEKRRSGGSPWKNNPFGSEFPFPYDTPKDNPFRQILGGTQSTISPDKIKLGIKDVPIMSTFKLEDFLKDSDKISETAESIFQELSNFLEASASKKKSKTQK